MTDNLYNNTNVIGGAATDMDVGGSHSGEQIVVNNYCPVSRVQVVFACVLAFAVSSLAAVPLHLLGLWPVWFFTVPVVLSVFVALRCTARPWKQVVSVSDRTVRVVDYGVGSSVSAWSSVTYWTRVVLRSRPHPWCTSHVFLRSHGREKELGVGRTGCSGQSQRDIAQLLASTIYRVTRYKRSLVDVG